MRHATTNFKRTAQRLCPYACAPAFLLFNHRVSTFDTPSSFLNFRLKTCQHAIAGSSRDTMFAMNTRGSRAPVRTEFAAIRCCAMAPGPQQWTPQRWGQPCSLLHVHRLQNVRTQLFACQCPGGRWPGLVALGSFLRSSILREHSQTAMHCSPSLTACARKSILRLGCLAGMSCQRQ